MASALDWCYEDRALAAGHSAIAGVDEAGRGPLAGPVVAAAYHFYARPLWLEDLDDSKKLSAAKREDLFARLHQPGIGVAACAIVDAAEIDRINILQASLEAMRRAIAALPVTPDYCLIDGNRMPGGEICGEAVIRGDGRSPSIAAASIIAKVTRDRMMVAYENEYPGYGFSRHKGYGTRQHLEALRRLGPISIHRRSFAPVQEAILHFGE